MPRVDGWEDTLDFSLLRKRLLLQTLQYKYKYKYKYKHKHKHKSVEETLTISFQCKLLLQTFYTATRIIRGSRCRYKASIEICTFLMSVLQIDLDELQQKNETLSCAYLLERRHYELNQYVCSCTGRIHH